MQDPYRMIVISIISSTILTFGLIFYKFIYPKKNINFFTLLILISILPIISMLRPGSYESGDLSEHIKLAMMFYNELTQGNFIPGWTDLGCSGYGCPIFSFIYIFPYYVISLFHTVGFSFVDSTKLLLASSFIISGVTMYYWIKDEFGEKAGFIAGIFYFFAPYHLVDLHFRNAIGEMTAFAILPLCFLFTKKILLNKKRKWILLNAIAITVLILSHLVATVISLPVLLIYGFIILKNKKVEKKFSSIRLTSSFLLGLLLTCFYWLPIALEGKYTLFGAHTTLSFYPLYDLLYSPWRYGLLFQGPNGEHSHLVGYVHIIMVLIGLFLLYKKKITKKYDKSMLLFFTISFLISFIMILPIAEPVWNTIPLLKSFQFSYRLLIFSSVCTSIIAAIILKNISNNKLLICICSLTIMITVLNWGNRKVLPEITDHVLHNQAFKTEIATSSLTQPIWSSNNSLYWEKRITEQNKIEVLSGQASIYTITNKSINREYIIHAKTNILLKENTFYYPGWKVFANNKELPIFYKDKQYPGLLIVNLKKGFYKIDVILTDTLPRKIGEYISLTTSAVIIFYIILLIIPKAPIFLKKILKVKHQS